MNCDGFDYSYTIKEYEKLKRGLKKEISVKVSSPGNPCGPVYEQADYVKTRILFMGLPIPFTSNTYETGSLTARKILQDINRPELA
jgi:hypothetical protein